MKIELQRVHYMPKDLEPGIFYYAEEFGAAAHLCACGCGTKIRTPIAPTEWSLKDGVNGISVCPSIGNWQHACRSHYWITDGEVEWSGQWTDEQVLAGRNKEAAHRTAYFEHKKVGIIRRIWRAALKRLTHRS